METPSSMRRVTRSQASTASQKTKNEDSVSKSRPNERSPLLDITNDSPIVGLATEKTPYSLAVKNWAQSKNTPGSGEALLRGQVKTLLQKVEEEAEFVNKIIPLVDRPPFRVVIGLPGPSPVQILAPTPANTPLLDNAPIEVAEAVKPEEEVLLSPLECSINRALHFDSPEKSEVTDASSAVSFEGSENRGYSEDDSSSAWSIQVNVSAQDEEEAEEIEEDFNENEEYDEDDGAEDFDDLCEGMNKMSVKETGVAEFTGKHTRFVYNSDGEIEGEEEVNLVSSPGVVVLKGLPVPEGKHLRFHEEEDEE